MENFERLNKDEFNSLYYRYRRLTPNADSGIIFAIEEIKNNTLYFAPPKQLNDPFECCFTLPTNVIKQNKELAEKFQKTLNKFFSNAGIVCFTKHHKKQLMWSYYAEGHSGICVVYDLKQIYLELNTINVKDYFIDAKNIDYNPTFPEISWDDNNIDEFYNVIFSKDKIWIGEDELRYVMLPTDHTCKTWNRVIKFKNQIITKVFLGNKISQWNEDLVRWACDEKNIPVEKMTLSTNRYKLS